jgi:hypothetical protein
VPGPMHHSSFGQKKELRLPRKAMSWCLMTSAP